MTLIAVKNLPDAIHTAVKAANCGADTCYYRESPSYANINEAIEGESLNSTYIIFV